jgi:hypothetical protein
MFVYHTGVRVYCLNHVLAGLIKNETSLCVFGNETLIAYLEEEYLENLNERVLIG